MDSLWNNTTGVRGGGEIPEVLSENPVPVPRCPPVCNNACSVEWAYYMYLKFMPAFTLLKLPAKVYIHLHCYSCGRRPFHTLQAG